MAVSLVPNGPSGGPFTPSCQTPERLPERKGAGARARVPQQVGISNTSTTTATTTTTASPQLVGNKWQYSNTNSYNNSGSGGAARKSRIVISQGECVIRKSTSYPAQKNLVGIIASMTDKDSSSSSRSSSEEPMRKVITSPSPTSTIPTQTSASLARALNDVALLHKQGKLSDSEYTEAKAVIINAEPPSTVSLGHIMDTPDHMNFQPGQQRRPDWDNSYSPRSPSLFDDELPQSTYAAAYGPKGTSSSQHNSYREQLSKHEHQVAALMDENTGLRQVAEKLQYQLKLSGGASPRGRSESPNRTVSISTLSGARDGEGLSMSPRRVGVSTSSFAAAVSDKFTNPFTSHFNPPPAAASKPSLPPTSPRSPRPSFDPTAALRAASASSPQAAYNSQPATPIQKTSKPQLRLPTRSPHRLSSPTVAGEAEWSLNSLRSPR